MGDNRVFIVSDDPALRDSLWELIASAGLRVERFQSLEQWLEAAPGCRDACLLFDAQLGVLTSTEPLARLTAACPGLPVLVLVDRGDVPIAVRAINQGAVDVLEKPLRGEDLLERIKMVAGTAWGGGAVRVPARHDHTSSERIPVDSRADAARGHPDGVVHRSLGFFVTRLVKHRPDGGLQTLHSRWHRKKLPAVELASDGSASLATPTQHPWRQLWAPQRLAWWIAILFLLGSASFAAGSFAANWPLGLPGALVGGGVINTVFFFGSLFFTGAAWLQVEEAINGDVADVGAPAEMSRRRWRWFAWKPHNAGYSAGLIQFVGTLLFNFNTGDAMLSQLTWLEEEVPIWTPDVIGSVCLLISSYLALVEISHRAWSYQPRQLSWWIVMLNLLGSIAFMLAAVFDYFLPSSGQAEWLWGANFFTLLGALCFFIASYLMIPELAGAGRVIDASCESLTTSTA